MADILSRIMGLIPLAIIVYVVVAVMTPILNDVIFPAYDNAPAGYSATPKLIFSIAIYILPALAMIMYLFRRDDEQNQPRFLG